MKKALCLLFICLVVAGLAGCGSSVSKSEYDALAAELDALKAQVEETPTPLPTHTLEPTPMLTSEPTPTPLPLREEIGIDINEFFTSLNERMKQNKIKGNFMKPGFSEHEYNGEHSFGSIFSRGSAYATAGGFINTRDEIIDFNITNGVLNEPKKKIPFDLLVDAVVYSIVENEDEAKRITEQLQIENADVGCRVEVEYDGIIFIAKKQREHSEWIAVIPEIIADYDISY